MEQPALVVTVPPSRDAGPTSVDAGFTTGEAAFAVLRGQHGVVHRVLHGVRQGDDPEDVHDGRVAVRRMRVAMRVFSEALPARIERMRDEWRWLGSVLGEVRDLDVHLQQLATWSAHAADDSERGALKMVAGLLEDRRTLARANVLKAIDSKRLERMNDALSTMLEHGPGRQPGARPPIVLSAPEMVVQRYRKVRSLGDHVGEDASPHAVHMLRIRLKRMRYTIEFFEPVYGKPARAFIRRVVALQDVLGAHQDAVAAVGLLHDIATDGRTLEPDVVFAMGRIAERFAAETASARRTLPDAYDALKGRRWRRLRAAMETAAAPVRDAAPRRAGSRARRAVPVPAPSMESDHSDEPPTMEES